MLSLREMCVKIVAQESLKVGVRSEIETECAERESARRDLYMKLIKQFSSSNARIFGGAVRDMWCAPNTVPKDVDVVFASYAHRDSAMELACKEIGATSRLLFERDAGLYGLLNHARFSLVVFHPGFLGTMTLFVDALVDSEFFSVLDFYPADTNVNALELCHTGLRTRDGRDLIDTLSDISNKTFTTELHYPFGSKQWDNHVYRLSKLVNAGWRYNLPECCSVARCSCKSIGGGSTPPTRATATPPPL